MSHPRYVDYKNAQARPRLPREGWIDLTYRCNYRCRHCWIWTPSADKTVSNELSLPEIIQIADQARLIGCNHWSISGGEPLLRSDFCDIFDYLTHKAVSYSLNTNGSLITPSIATRLKRKGYKLVALYGADAHVYDHITRTPGSFEAFIQGCTYLKEANAGFTIQIIPMRDNYHQLEAMFDLAKSLSPSYRIGASWLYLTAENHRERNKEIIRQRLSPREICAMDPDIPEFGLATTNAHPENPSDRCKGMQDKMLWSCIMESQQFHIDPYGGMSFCSTIKDPAMRFNLRQHTMQKIWDALLPALAEYLTDPEEYRQNCGCCDLRNYCSWCPAYGYLESGRLSAPINYLCEDAKERKKYEDDWRKNNRRFFMIAGMTLQIDSNLPFPENAFQDRFKEFQIEEPGEDLLKIHHHYALPDMAQFNDAKLIYDQNPWRIYRFGSYWIYKVAGSKTASEIEAIAIFNDAHTQADIYHRDDHLIRACKLGSLTTFPSDHIMLARALAERQGCVMHCSGLILNDHGLLFMGPSGAGKSTVVKLLRNFGKVLCDDRIIVKRQADGFHIHGTWSHGEIPEVSNAQAPLKAIFLLKKSKKNQLTLLTDKQQIIHELLFRTARPLVTIDWLDKTLSLLTTLAKEVPVYQFAFTRDERMFNLVEEVVGPLANAAAAVTASAKQV